MATHLDPNTSRRLAYAMQAEPARSRRQEIIEAIDMIEVEETPSNPLHLATFDQLPDDVKQIVLDSEAEIARQGGELPYS